MEKANKIRTANILRNIARYSLLTISILVFIFALLSGSEDYGGGISGIIQNSPNALPWLILLVLTFIAWKWELIGGIIITIMGLFMVYFFNFQGQNFFVITFTITSIIVLLGLLFIISWNLRKE
jgi:hypothetical protein